MSTWPVLANAAANLSKTMGDSGAKAPTQAEIDKVVKQLNDVVKKAHVDLWVGKADHKVHRVAFAVDAAMDDATKNSSGLESLALNFDVTTVDAEAPDVSAPVLGRHLRRVPDRAHRPARQGHGRRRRRLSRRPTRRPSGEGAAIARPPRYGPGRCTAPPQLVLLDVDFTLIRPRRVFDANGYAELGARFGIRLDPERYEQARQAAFHVWQTQTLEHRSAQHRRFATEIVRGMGAPRAVAEQIGIAAEQEWGDPGNFELFPDVAPLLASSVRAAARSASSPTPIASSSPSPRSSGSPWTSRSRRARMAGASRARRSSPPRWRSAARRPRRP